MDNIMLLVGTLVVFTTALIEVVKHTFNVKKWFIPLAAALVGLAVGALATFIDADLSIRLWGGLGAGLSSVGLFEVAKNLKGDE